MQESDVKFDPAIASALLGLLSWLAMQCLGKMLCIWRGSLAEFMSAFVDKELLYIYR
jgi:hypothetical protein